MSDGRIQITGYYTPDDDERDENSPTGLTAEAFDRIIYSSDGTGTPISDLEDVEVEVE